MQTFDMFCDGAFASVCAVIVSNPFDVIRTRMQLQGQMRRAGEYEVLYRNMFQGMFAIAKEEGLRSLQKGLVPAMCWQIAQNGISVGLYPLIKAEVGRAADRVQGQYRLLVRHRDSDPDGDVGERAEGAASSVRPWSESQIFLVSVAAGGISGVAGAFVASPFTLVKTRLQSQHGSPAAASPVQQARRQLSEASTGTQFHYKGVYDALRQVYQRGGVRGLWHGAGIASQRTMIYSSVQLTSYDYTRRYWAWGLRLPESDTRVHILAGITASFFVVLFTNPFNVAMTRVYNSRRQQATANVATPPPKPSANIFKQVVAINRVEGVRGLYKGSGAFFVRTAPHGMVTFVVLEWVRKMRETYTPDRAYTSGSNLNTKTIGAFRPICHEGDGEAR